MCGIAGLIHKGATGQIGKEMTSMLQALKHRGPDSTGFALYGPPDADHHVMRFKVAEQEDVRKGFDIHHQMRERKATVDERMAEMGARIESTETGSAGGEPIGRLAAQPSALRPFRIHEALVPGLIDEIPLLCVLAARAAGVSYVEGASELRVKESDRIALMADNLGALGIHCEVRPDGVMLRSIPGLAT